MKALFKRAQKRAKALGRIGVAVAVLGSPLAFAAPASAGTLSTPTWTVMDPRTNIAGNRYDYGFTTATAGTVSRVTATVPAGTTGSNRYLALNGVAGNYVSTPDSTANSVSGNLDLRAKVSIPGWRPAGTAVLLSKWISGDYSYTFSVGSGGGVFLAASSSGNYSAGNVYNSTVNLPTSSPASLWLRTTLTLNDGSSESAVSFYTSTDGTSWTQLGTTLTGTVLSSLHDATSNLQVGAQNGASSFPGKLYYADIRSGISGTTTSPSNCTATNVVQCFDPSNDVVGGTSWTSADTAGETWTVNRSGTNAPADIASDLSVMNVSGLPSGGTAQLREIDGVASYALPTPTSVASATAAKLGLAGMTNAYTAGSYTSVIKTLDSTSTAIDTSAATSAVSFTTTSATAIGSTPSTYYTAASAASVPFTPWALSISGSTVYASNLYSSTVSGLNTGNGQLQTLTGNGSTAAVSLATGPASSTAYWIPQGVASDSSGNVFVADSYQSNIRKIASGNASLYGGTGTSGFSDGAATTNQIAFPNGMITDASGNLYFADSNNNRIRKISTSGTLSTVAGNGTANFSGDGGAATSATLNYPTDVAVATNGDLYISDKGNGRIRKVDNATGNISTFAGTGVAGNTGDGAAATSAKIGGVYGLAVDSIGNVYIADGSYSVVRKVNTSGTISTIAGSGSCAFSGDGSAATSASLCAPRQIRVDASGNLFFADYGNNRVREITSGGVMQTVIGNGTSESWSGDGGNVSSAHFWQINQTWPTANGDLYLAEQNNNVIRKIDQWGTVTTVAGSGPLKGGYTGDGGPATSATLNGPNGVAVANDGTIYIADTTNNAIRKVSSGAISTLATMTKPFRLALDSSGNLLATSSSACVVNKFSSSGSLLTTYGNGTCATAGDGSAATSASFNTPRDVAVNPAGEIFISEYTSNKIRKIDLNGVVSTVFGGGAGTGSNIPALSSNIGVRGLAFDPLGNLYFSSGTSLRSMTPGGIVFAPGSGLVSANGGISFSNGAAYISDYNAQVLRKVDSVVPTAPLVNADGMSVAMNTATNWPILSNDWSRSNEMDPSSVTITSQPTHGTVTITNPTTEASTLQARYTPTTSFTGADSFAYQACDTTRVLCATATVSVTVGSNQVTSVVGGSPLEGYATSIGFRPGRIARFNNYLFYSDASYNLVRRLDLYTNQTVVVAGNYATLLGGDGLVATSASMNAPQGLAFDPSGKLYIANNGGSGVIRQVALNGTITSFTGTLSAPTAIAFTQAGTLLATTGSIVQSWSGSAWVTFAGSTSGSSGDGGLATSAQFNNPSGLYGAPNGDVYISDGGACTVRRVTANNVYAFAGISGTCSLSGDGGAATSATMNSPRGISMDSAGTLLITDYNSSKIRKVSTTGIITSATAGASNPIDIAAGLSTDYYVDQQGNNSLTYTNTSGVSSAFTTNAVQYYSGEGTPGPSTPLIASTPEGVAADAAGNIYFSSDLARIQKLDATTGLVTTLVGNGTSGYGANQIASQARQFAFDTSGRLVFPDYGNKIIRRVDAVGSMTTLAGTASTTGSTGDGGAATSATLNTPVSVVIAPDGAMYIGEAGKIRKVSPGGIISTFAGTGVLGTSGDGGLAINAQINNPTSLALDSNGNVYYADYTNYVVRMIDTKGIITTIAGIAGTNSNGVNGSVARGTGIGIPSGLAIDNAGNVYIADSNNQKIRKVDAITGLLSTAVGTGVSGFADNAALLSSQMYTPRGMYMNPTNGNLYFNDTGNRRIRVASALGTTAANSLTSSSWNVVPANTGHLNLRETFVLNPSVTAASAKLTITMPTSVAGTTLSVINQYGLTGSVTASLSGTTLTVTYPSQTLTAGVSIGFAIEGWTNGGANGAYTSYVTQYDSAGTTAIGWSHSNIVNITSSGAPTAADAGFGSVWQKSLTTTQAAFATTSVSPAGTADSTTSFTLTNSGNLNADTATLSAGTMTTGSRTLSPITTDSTTSVASASFATNRWGLQFVTSTGTNSTSGSGYFSGLTLASIATGAGATNVLTTTARAKVDYLQPAGTYKSTLTWRFTGGV